MPGKRRIPISFDVYLVQHQQQFSLQGMHCALLERCDWTQPRVVRSDQTRTTHCVGMSTIREFLKFSERGILPARHQFYHVVWQVVPRRSRTLLHSKASPSAPPFRFDFSIFLPKECVVHLLRSQDHLVCQHRPLGILSVLGFVMDMNIKAVDGFPSSDGSAGNVIGDETRRLSLHLGLGESPGMAPPSTLQRLSPSFSTSEPRTRATGQSASCHLTPSKSSHTSTESP